MVFICRRLAMLFRMVGLRFCSQKQGSKQISPTPIQFIYPHGKQPVGYGEDFVDFRDKVFQKELFYLNYANRIIRAKKCTIIKQDRTIAYIDSIVGKFWGKQAQYVAFGQCICFNTIIGRIALPSLLYIFTRISSAIFHIDEISWLMLFISLSSIQWELHKLRLHVDRRIFLLPSTPLRRTGLSFCPYQSLLLMFLG